MAASTQHLDRFRRWLAAHPAQAGWVLVAVGLACYLTALPNALVWDDLDWIVGNTYVHDFGYLRELFSQSVTAGAGIVSNYWRPLLSLTFAFEWQAWGDWAPGYHAVSLLVHLAAGAVLWRYLRRLTGRPLLSFGTALVFLVHPVQVEAVAFVAGRGDALSVLLMLAALNRYLTYLERRQVGAWWGAAAIFVLAFMVKETAVVLPGLVLLTDWYYWRKATNPEPWRVYLRDVAVRLAPFAGLALGYVLLRGTLLNFQNTFNLYSEVNAYTEHLWVRLLTFAAASTWYLGLLVAPIRLHMERQLAFQTSLFEPVVLLGLALITGALVLAVRSFRRAPERTFGVLWAAVALAPVSGLVAPVSGLVYEHFLYLALPGAALVAGSYLAGALRLWPRLRPYLAGVSLMFLFALGLRTVIQNRVWSTPITLYEHVLRYNQSSLRVWNNLGMAYDEADRHEDAVAAYQRAIALDGAHESAPPRHNLGVSYQALGRTAEAIRAYRAALEIDPGFIFSYQNLVALYVKQGRYAEAKQALEQALQRFPRNERFEYNLRAVEQLMGQLLR